MLVELFAASNSNSLCKDVSKDIVNDMGILDTFPSVKSLFNLCGILLLPAGVCKLAKALAFGYHGRQPVVVYFFF